MLSLLLGLCCQDAYACLRFKYELWGFPRKAQSRREGLHGTCKIQDIESKRGPGNCSCSDPSPGEDRVGARAISCGVSFSLVCHVGGSSPYKSPHSISIPESYEEEKMH